MSQISKSKKLLEKSINSAVSAIEIYNKPDFKYREEVFSILMINAWELLLKSKILQENNNKLESLYIRQKVKNKKGVNTNKWKYKESRSGNKMTVDIFKAIERLLKKGVVIDKAVRENINLLVEIRDNAIHFYNVDQYFSLKVQEVGLASLKSFVVFVNSWFSYDLGRYNFFLMPLTFFHQSEMESFSINPRDKQQENLLDYISNTEKEYKDVVGDHSVTLSIKTKYEKSPDVGAIAIRITNDPSAPVMSLSSEQLLERYKWDSEELWEKLKNRYRDIKKTKSYNTLKKQYEEDPKYCYKRPYNPKKPSSGVKCYFDPNVVQEFDKYYTKKD